MPQITFNISTDDLARLVAAKSQNYQPKIWQDGQLVDNPETKQQFVMREQREQWKREVVAFERAQAQQAVPEPQEPIIT